MNVKDPIGVLDAISCEIVARATRENRALGPDELHALAVAADLIENDKASSLFASSATPQSITADLRKGGTASFGIVDEIRDAVTAVTDRVRNTVSTVGFGAVRGFLSPAVGLFLGDVFAYLKEGDLRDKIRSEIAGALAEAHKDATIGNKGPLIVVAHSMGGVILIDMLADPSKVGLPANFRIKALITVGSQPGLFGALDALSPSLPPGAPRQRPACVDNWLNVFDPIDPLAFRADVIFDKVSDMTFNSVAGLAASHTTYFDRAQFYARSRKRLQDYGVL